MLDWMLACSSIAGFSVVVLELFGDKPGTLKMEPAPARLRGGAWY